MADFKPKPLDWTAQLVMLRGMTERFGSIHEAQALQLKLWPFTVDPMLVNTKAEIDMEGKRIDFYWVSSYIRSSIDKKYKKRLKELESNVKFLLGADWTMTVHLNQTLIFPIDTKNGKARRQLRRRRRRQI